jgi:hypothetical protein
VIEPVTLPDDVYISKLSFENKLAGIKKIARSEILYFICIRVYY